MLEMIISGYLDHTKNAWLMNICMIYFVIVYACFEMFPFAMNFSKDEVRKRYALRLFTMRGALSTPSAMLTYVRNIAINYRHVNVNGIVVC